jgi:hypothetical protein
MFVVEELGEEIATLSVHLDAARHRLLQCIRQFDESRGWYAQGAVSCAHWLSWRIGLDLGTAREKVRVANALAELPKIDEALRVGKLSYAKVRALTRVATAANEAKLIDLALAATGAQLERICRGYRGAMNQDRPCVPEDRSVRKRLLPGGMVKLEIVLSADEADLVMRAVDCAREISAEVSTPLAVARSFVAGTAAPLPSRFASRPLPAARGEVSGHTPAAETGTDSSAETCDEFPTWPSRPDGVVALAAHYLAGNRGDGTGADRYQVMVHVDQDPLAPDGVVAATLEDGTGIPAETFRRIACDCRLLAQGGRRDDTAMSVGRLSRSIPPTIQRALRLRDQGCCFPGCTHTRFLHGHHVRHWLHGGETSLANLLLLCPFHHRLIHEGGWTIDRDSDGNWLFVAPTGASVANPQSQAWEGNIQTWLEEWADKHSLDLGPDTNEPMWDGTPVDYDLAVGLLAGGGEG